MRYGFGRPVGERFALRTAWAGAVVHRAPLVVIGGAVAVLFLLRFAVLAQSPYPPSSDAGGDLYVLHSWLGQGPPGGSEFPRLPPLYSFAVVWPLTTIFGPFTGIEVAMALVPALLALPAYLYFRQSSMGPIGCITAAVLVAGSSAFSLMMTWNDAFSLFSILLLLAFTTALVVALRDGGRARAALAGLLFGAVAAAHELTFFIAVLVLAVTVGGTVVAGDGPFRDRWRRPAVLGGACALGAAPMVGVYVALVRGGANVGVGSYVGALTPTYAAAWFFPWGVQSGPFPAYLVLDVIFAALGILLWTYWPRDSVAYRASILGLFVGALVVPWVDAAEGVRGLYYLPIPLAGAVAVVVDRLPGLFRSWRERLVLRSPRTREGPVARWVARAPVGPWATTLAAVAVAGVVVATNLVYSESVAAAGAAYYRVLDGNRVSALDWVRTNTAVNASVYDGAGLSAWMWGYAERQEYAPQPLFAQSTAVSYAAALDGDHLDMGAYLVGDGDVVVGSNLPGPVGDPAVFVALPGEWVPFLTALSPEQTFWVASAGTERPLALSAASVASVTSFNGTNGTTGFEYALWWPGARVGISVGVSVAGTTASFSFASNDSSAVSADWAFAIPPSGYFLTYAIGSGSSPSGFVGSFRDLAGAPVTATMTGGSFSWFPESNGWSRLAFNGTSLTMSIVGPVAPGPAFFLDTSQLCARLGIGWAVVDISEDPGMYGRLLAGVPGELSGVVRAQYGPIFVFEVRAA